MAIERDLTPDLSSETLAHILGVPRAYLLKRSVDARKKSDVHFVANALTCNDADFLAGGQTGSLQSADLQSGIPQEIIPFDKRPNPLTRTAFSQINNGEHPASMRPEFGEHPASECSIDERPVIVGAGPAGLFAALELAQYGLQPLLIERGAPVEQRKKDVEHYIKTRILNTASNVQFGEGGAGTFSDGKLTTGKNSPLVRQILQSFVAGGAPQEILWQAKPHIGTDVLSGVVAALRRQIIACGGAVHFFSQLVGLEIEHGQLKAILVREACEKDAKNSYKELRIPCKNLILACGHSARDTFEMLQKCGIKMQAKPFSMGLRIEHLQKDINRAQYGAFANHPALGAADYKLNCKTNAGRGVYSFCMCPGGSIVAASSEEGALCVNGMSVQARNGKNANAAILVDVRPQDFLNRNNDPLSGVTFQRYWEHKAYVLGGSNWCAPVQYVGDFLSCKKHGALKVGSSYPLVEPSYPLGTTEADLKNCLPDFVVSNLAQGIKNFGRRLNGFDSSGAILTGIEARSSSPVRILRNKETLQSENVSGLFPCGEGCGYAGGIMSAAMDGIKCARALLDHIHK